MIQRKCKEKDRLYAVLHRDMLRFVEGLLGTENHGVGGSIPPLGTIFVFMYQLVITNHRIRFQNPIQNAFRI